MMQSKESWDTYLASYESGFSGTTALRMDLIERVPIKEFSNVLVTGVSYFSERKDRFPENFDVLYQIEDQLKSHLLCQYNLVFVGTFTHNLERLQYYYLADTANLEEFVKKFYAENFPDHKYYINIKEDKDWRYYKEFLYPNPEILERMSDSKVISNLVSQGDPLKKSRPISYWIEFTSETTRELFEQEIKEQGFDVQNKYYSEEENLFVIVIVRTDIPNTELIELMSKKIGKIASKYGGNYNGWETIVINEK